MTDGAADMSDDARKLKVEHRRNAVESSARDLLSHLMQLREYEPLSVEDETLVRMLLERQG